MIVSVRAYSDGSLKGFVLSLTKDEVNALYRNEGNVETVITDREGYEVELTLTTSETRDTFRKPA